MISGDKLMEEKSAEDYQIHRSHMRFVAVVLQLNIV